MKKYKNELCIFACSTLVYLLFNWLLPITDPVESNYALTAKEMLQSGDIFSTRIYGQYWYDKPIFIYWMIILSYEMFGINAFAARLPMAIASGLSLSFLYWFVCKIYSNRIAYLSVGILATCLEFWVIGKVVITDALLFLFDGSALGLIYLALLTKKRKYYWGAYLMAGFAVLTKGSVGIVLPGLIVIVYLGVTRQWRCFKELDFYWGVLLFLLVTLPWYGYMYAIHGNAFIEGFLGLHNVTRATVSEHPSDNVFYYYLLVLPLCLLPWTGIFFKSLQMWFKERTVDPHRTFLFCWIGVTVIFYTFMATKYITYVFISMLPLAAFMAVYLDQLIYKPMSRITWLWLTVPVVALFILLFMGVYIILPGGYLIPCGVLFIQFIVSLYLQVKGSAKQVVVGTMISFTVLIISLSAFALPQYAKMRSTDIVDHLPQNQDAQIGIYGDYETSAVFYSGHTIIKLEEAAAEKGSWSGKYMMPQATFTTFEEETKENNQVYIIVSQKNNWKFSMSSFAENYRLVLADKNHMLYQKNF